MVRQINPTVSVINGKSYMKFAGKDTDTKPEADYIATGSEFWEINTKTVYLYDETGDAGSKWIEFVSFGDDA